MRGEEEAYGGAAEEARRSDLQVRGSILSLTRIQGHRSHRTTR